MNTNIIKGVPLQNYNQLYSDFSKKCLTNQPSLQEVKSDFVHLKGKYIHSRQIDNFCTKTVELIKYLINNGNEKLANMLINEIGKIHMSFRNYGEAESFIRYSMNLSQKAGDNFHVLARLNDLEQIYRYENKKKKVFEILRLKKNV